MTSFSKADDQTGVQLLDVSSSYWTQPSAAAAADK